MFSSLNAFSEALQDLPPANEAWRTEALARQQQLTKPAGSLGRLEDCAVFLAGWGHVPQPRADRMRVIVFAGNHGVTARGVSPFPPDVTAQMVANFAHGGAAINAISAACGAELEVVPLSLDAPTGDISRGPALSEGELLEALNAGAAAVAKGGDVLAFGEMGIGNTTIAAALAARSLGGTGADWAGPGTGLGADGVARKAAVIDEALALHAAIGRKRRRNPAPFRRTGTGGHRRRGARRAARADPGGSRRLCRHRRASRRCSGRTRIFSLIALPAIVPPNPRIGGCFRPSRCEPLLDLRHAAGRRHRRGAGPGRDASGGRGA